MSDWGRFYLILDINKKIATCPTWAKQVQKSENKILKTKNIHETWKPHFWCFRVLELMFRHVSIPLKSVRKFCFTVKKLLECENEADFRTFSVPFLRYSIQDLMFIFLTECLTLHYKFATPKRFLALKIM